MSKIKRKAYENVKYPLLGAAYYPEDWDESEQDNDIKKMVEYGIDCVRIGEFAWKRMEPSEGVFDFGWLHRVVDRLYKNGISVVLGTPSATLPTWLQKLDVGVFKLHENGIREAHGGRRQGCSNNQTYRKHTAIVVEKLAREFGNDKNVIGWQLDNEIDIGGNGCFCDDCINGFRCYLKNKYGAVEILNKAWDLNIFSQAYDSFDDIQRPYGTQNPHIKYEWLNYQAQVNIDFLKLQADIIHNFSDRPVGTDLMPFFNMDYAGIAEFCDVMMYNHYDDENSLKMSTFFMDYVRPLSSVPFWNTETATCWNAGTEVGGNLRPRGFCRANSWMPIAAGGAVNMYWLWRQHWGGHELMHGAVLYASGRPMHIVDEVIQVSDEFKRAAYFINGTFVQTEAAISVSTHNHFLTMNQAVYSDEYPWYDRYSNRVRRVYSALKESGIQTDVIAHGADLGKYRLLFSPFEMYMETDFTERVMEWVEKGGTWVAGPFTDIRDGVGAHFTDRETGCLEKNLNCELLHQIPDTEGRVCLIWENGDRFTGEKMVQLYGTDDSSESLVRADGNFFEAFGNLSAVFSKKYGRGRVIVLGALPSSDDLKRIIDLSVDYSGVRRIRTRGNVTAYRRKGRLYEGLIAIETSGKTGGILLDGEYDDILAGGRFSGDTELSPFEVLVLKKVSKK